MAKFCLLDLILYIPVNIFLIVRTGLTKQELMGLAQGDNAVTLVRLRPATPRSQVKHSTTALP